MTADAFTSPFRSRRHAPNATHTIPVSNKNWCAKPPFPAQGMFHSSLVLLVTALAGLAQAQHLTFSDPTLTTNDSFGYSVALDEQYLLVGAPGDDTIGLDVGQAHLYSLMTGELAHTFNDPTPIIVDNFGAAVALNGNHVLIGANRHGGGVGQVHLFDARTGAFLQTFDDPTPTNFDHFGTSVAIDGNYVLVGAPGDDSNGFENGQAYLFDVATGALLHTFNDPTVTTEDSFGWSVSLLGEQVLIGAPGDDTNGLDVGQVHAFDATTGVLVRTFDDPTVTVTDRFGFSVTQDGNDILIGAPGDNGNGHDVGQAYLLETTTGSLVHTFDDPTVTDSDLFGGAVALDGNHVLVAASIDDTNGTNVGQTHLFEANTGVLLHTFDDPTPTDSDFFGRAVALHGNRAAVGAPFDDTHRTDSGQAHLFAVPEPSLGILLASAVLGLAVVRRREPIH